MPSEPRAPAAPRSRRAALWGWFREDFRRGVALGIAAVSVFGAVVAWQASKTSGDAGGLDGQALSDLIEQQQDRAKVRAELASDRRLLATYSEHLDSADAFEAALRRPGTTAARRLDLAAQAQGERSLAKTEYYFFQIATPVDDGHGGYELDQANVRDALAETDARVRPREQSSLADVTDSRARRLTVASTLFVAALFFLTLAQLARTSVWRLFASSGVAVGLFALALFVLA